MLVAVLTRVPRRRHRDAFMAALPVAGVDGTAGQPHEGHEGRRQRPAKTGSIANARSLSGFVASASGEPLVFSMIVNNFNASRRRTPSTRSIRRSCGWQVPALDQSARMAASAALLLRGGGRGGRCRSSARSAGWASAAARRWLVPLAGAAGAQTSSAGPRSQPMSRRETKLDEFAPIYQFSEIQSIPVRAGGARLRIALRRDGCRSAPVRELAWIRRGGASGPERAEPQRRRPPGGRGHEDVVPAVGGRAGAGTHLGTVVMAPPGVRLAAAPTPAAFQALRQPGFAKAVMGFVIEAQDSGWCRLRSEIRMHATDPASARRSPPTGRSSRPAAS